MSERGGGSDGADLPAASTTSSVMNSDGKVISDFHRSL